MLRDTFFRVKGQRLAETLTDDEFESRMECGGVTDKLPCNFKTCEFYNFCASFAAHKNEEEKCQNTK